MRWRGLEPPRPVRATRPSTLRVYQFRHQRVDGRIVAATRRLTPSEALATLYEQMFDQEGGRCSRSVSARSTSLCSATWIRTGIRPPCARSEGGGTGVAVDRARPSGQPRASRLSAPRPDEAAGARADPARALGCRRDGLGRRTWARSACSRSWARSPPADRSSRRKTSRSTWPSRTRSRAGRGVPAPRQGRQHDRGRHPRGRLRRRAAPADREGRRHRRRSPARTRPPTRRPSSASSARAGASGCSPRTPPWSRSTRARQRPGQGRGRLRRVG